MRQVQRTLRVLALLFGGKQLANFTVYSYPAAASYAVGAAALLLVLALVLAWRRARSAARPAMAERTA